MKKSFIFLIFSLVLISACTQQESSVAPTQIVQPIEESSGSNEVIGSTGNVKEFTMTAKQWEFVPDTITVNKGDTVKLNIESVDVAHGIAIPEFGVSNKDLVPGKTVNVEFVADKTGTFNFFCNVQCGSGHGGMRGTLLVE